MLFVQYSDRQCNRCNQTHRVFAVFHSGEVEQKVTCLSFLCILTTLQHNSVKLCNGAQVVHISRELSARYIKDTVNVWTALAASSDVRSRKLYTLL